MSPPAVALGLVGCGRLAEVGYLPAVAATPGVDLVAVADPDAVRRARVADLASSLRAGEVGAFTDAPSLIEGARIDGIVLATPAGAHLDDAAAAARASIPTLVEKPPAADAATARILAALDPPPWVGFNRRFDAGARAVRARLPADGKIQLRLSISYRRNGWGAHSVHDDALLDLGPHLIDWARWLSDSEVTDVQSARLAGDRAQLRLTLARGSATVIAATDRPHAELIELRDHRGVVLARHRLGGLVAAVRGRLQGGGPNALVATLAEQLAAFAAATRGDDPSHLGTAGDGHAVMRIVDAARQSASGSRTVHVPHSVEP